MNGTSRALVAGAAGAVAVTVANEIGRRTTSGAPRLDLLGERAVARVVGQRTRGVRPSTRRKVKRTALAGDLVANAAYYALFARTGAVGGAWWGTLAGLGAVILGPRLGLGHRPTDASVRTAGLAIAWYALGGVVAGVVARTLARRARDRDVPQFEPPYPYVKA